MDAELLELGVHEAQELPTNWRYLRGGRPRRGWGVYAILVGRQRGIITDPDTAHRSTDGYSNAVKEGFRNGDEWLARAWLRDAVMRRHAGPPDGE